MKKFYLLSLMIFISMVTNSILFSYSAITNAPHAGRLGDQLLLYVKTKWLAHKYNLAFYLRPFTYSNQLVLDQYEKKYNQTVEQKHKDKTALKSENEIKNSPESSILYTCGFHCKTHENVYDASVKDKLFAHHLKELIKPINTPTLNLPSDKISVAIHVRKGTGFDGALSSQQIYKMTDRSWPLKFPPEQFYINQLKELYNLLGSRSLYVFIFTDDPNPKQIVNHFKEQCSFSNIIYDYREHGNSHNRNVVADLWIMSKFDCLIRPQSAFSIVSGLIGDTKIVISPIAFNWQGKKLIINKTQATIQYNNNVQLYSFNSSNQELKTQLQSIL